MPLDPTPVPTGSEIRVDPITGGWYNSHGYNGDRQITGLADGGFVVAWPGAARDGAPGGVFVKRYSVSGDAIGGEVRVHEASASFGSNPSIAALADGGFVVAWDGQNSAEGGPVGVTARRFSASGEAIGGELLVAAPETPTFDNEAPSVSGLADGGFVVTWERDVRPFEGPRDISVFGQRYTASGEAVGGEFRVSTTITKYVSEPSVAGLGDGGFVVTWATFNPDSGTFDIFAQRFSASGGAAGSEFRVNADAYGEQRNPSIAALADGGFVVTWSGSAPEGGGEIFGQRFSASGAALGDEFQIGAAWAAQTYPSVAALGDGGFVVIWENFTRGSVGYEGAFGQRFSASGAPAGDEFRVGGSGEAPFVAGLADGGFVVGRDVVRWGAKPADTTYDLYVQRFVVDPQAGIVGVEAATAAKPEGDVGSTTTFAFDVTLDAAAPAARSVRWQVAGHGARPADAADFAGGVLPSGELVFAAGETRKTVAVHVAGDAVVEGDEGFALRLMSPSDGLVVGAAGSAAATILDDNLPASPPAAPVEAGIAARGASQVEGDAGAATAFTFDITLDAAASTSQSVRWQVDGIGARPADAADFDDGILPSGTLTFAAGETRKTITVRVAGDAVVERDEGFAVSLWAPSDGLAIGAGGTAAATILDDDMPASTPPAHAAQVMRLYDAALDRSPERAGFEFWVGALGTGEALSSLAAGFLASSEFAARFGDSSADDGAFVDRLYQNVLGRAGEAEGRAFWGESLGKGCTRAEVLAAFSESAEHVALTAARLDGGADLLIA